MSPPSGSGSSRISPLNQSRFAGVAVEPFGDLPAVKLGGARQDGKHFMTEHRITTSPAHMRRH
jgi:hypothetical protein